MKVQELFEAARNEPWSKKGTLNARIVLSQFTSDITNAHKFSRDVFNELEKQARAKFKKMVEDHPDGLRFKTYDEAKEYMAKMELPNWAVRIELNSRERGISRKTAIEAGEVKDDTIDDIAIKEVGEGKYEVSTRATSGAPVSVLQYLVSVAREAKLEVTSKTGIVLKYMGDFKGRALIVKGSKEAVELALAKAKKSYTKEADGKAARKAQKEDPEYKKAVNKANYEYQKEQKAKLDAEYGADIVKRVKVKSIRADGDDGYQWGLFVDGQVKKRGMTKYQAEGERRMMMAYLKKIAKMTPEELKKEAEVAEGMRLYFMLDYLLKNKEIYLAQAAINKASNSAKAETEYNALIKRLQSKN